MSVSLRLPEDLNQRLSSLAAQTGRSKTFYMGSIQKTEFKAR